MTVTRFFVPDSLSYVIAFFRPFPIISVYSQQMDIEHDRELNDFLLYAKSELPNATQHSRDRFVYQMCIDTKNLSAEELERAMIQKLYGRCKFALREKPIEYIKNLYRIKQIWFKLAYIR